VVRITDAEGHVGLGEAAPLEPWTEDLKRCAAALEDAAGVLAGPVGEAQRALDKLDVHVRALQHCRAARHGLALALLDLAAQQRGMPLGAYLAGQFLDGAPPADRVEVNALLGTADPKAAAAEAAELLARGYRSFKLKLAGPRDADLERVAAARSAIGHAELRLDANGAWDRAEAAGRLRELAAFAPAFVEQPVPATDVEGLADLRRMSLVPIAADEAAATPAAAERVLAAGAADVLIVKPMALGGPDRAVEVLAAAQRAGVPCVVTSLLDGPIARAGALHVAACAPPPRRACGLGTIALFGGMKDDVRDGSLAVPRGRGLGLGGTRG
jgi:L-alanine-DL-glutamate epimerase-like enolase superfamily enzyme